MSAMVVPGSGRDEYAVGREISLQRDAGACAGS